jgi:hypothetical protein
VFAMRITGEGAGNSTRGRVRYPAHIARNGEAGSTFRAASAERKSGVEPPALQSLAALTRRIG